MIVYTVKNIKTLHGWDPGEDGFLADLYCYGTKLGKVGVDANGGCERFDIDNKEYKALVKYAHAALGKMDEYRKPEAKWSHSAVTFEFILKLVTEYENRKWLKRHGKKKTVFKLKGSKDGEFLVMQSAPYSPFMHRRIIEKYGSELEAVYDQSGEKVTELPA